MTKLKCADCGKDAINENVQICKDCLLAIANDPKSFTKEEVFGNKE